MISFQMLLIASVLVLLSMIQSTQCFLVNKPTSRWGLVSTYMTKDEENSDTTDDKSTSKSKGDKLREATGIRPSLHPPTINAIAEALKARAMNKADMPLRISDSVPPIEVAMTASKIASAAITKRQGTSDQDGMKLLPEEEQTIAGRVMGVVMRFDELEAALSEKVSTVDWIAKYNEWATFGVVKDDTMTQDMLKNDPLLCMSRAECLLAIFLNTVEAPQLEKVGESVPDGSKIDFLDSDRAEVLLNVQ